jgi:hypothetical protein
MAACGCGGEGIAAAGFAHHELAWQRADARLDRLALGKLQDQASGLAAQFLEIHVDSGERRARGRRDDFPIIETDDRDIRRHADTAFAQGIDDATGDLVIAAENAVGRRRFRPQSGNSLVTPGFRPGAVQHGRIGACDSPEGGGAAGDGRSLSGQ